MRAGVSHPGAARPRRWIEPAPIPVSAELSAAAGGQPLAAVALARRCLAEPAAARAFLDPACYTPTPPAALPGLTRAAERLEAAIGAQEPVCVWGDFDVDGQTATTVLVSALADLGAVVSYHIPVRATESHGVNLPVLAQLLDAGGRLILTCDTGIASHKAVAFARSRGVEFIITDHHDLPATLPDAYAVVNPKLGPVEESGLAHLPGVGVAYKLAEELYHRAGRPEAAAALLDLVALGIVADLATLRGDTRYLLQRGLAALRQTQRLGLRLLMENAELDPARLTEEHISYVIAPRLNALGRLADANVAVEFLRVMDAPTDSAGAATRARILAGQIEALNGQRKLLCDQVYAAAEAQIGRDPSLLEGAALVLASPAWPAGVIGIVASRLVERYGKPTVLLATPAGELARGSARSAAGVNITAALAAHADLLTSFGGHPMAAGLSMSADRIAELRRGLARTIGALPAEAHEQPGLAIDDYLPLSDLTLDLVDELERLAPFGPGNPPITLVSRDLRVRNRRAVGRRGEHLLVVVEDAWGAAHKVIWWDSAAESLPEGVFDLAYVARSSDYRGAREVQIEWIDGRPVETPAPEVTRALSGVEVIDHRAAPNPLAIVADLIADGEATLWQEAVAAAGPDDPLRHGRARHELTRSSTLIVWTAPAGQAEWRAALATVQPARVYLFGRDPGLDQPGAFLRRLSGLVKHARRARGGQVSVTALAAATAQREAAVRLGLGWLAAAGHLVIVSEAEDAIIVDELAAPPQADAERSSELAGRLQALLAETAAYRAFFRQADPQRLVAS